MLKERNITFVVVMSIITLMIYYIYWLVKTTQEIKEQGSDAPNPLLLFILIIPVINIFVLAYYLQKYTKALETATNGVANRMKAFLLLFFIFPAGAAYVQSELNKIAIAAPTPMPEIV